MPAACAAESVGNLDRVLQRFGKAHALSGNQFIERFAANELHGNEVLAIRLIDVVDGDNAPVVQRRRRLGFLHKTAAALGLRSLARGQKLDRGESIEARVASLPDNAHAAFAQLFDYFILTDCAHTATRPPWN